MAGEIYDEWNGLDFGWNGTAETYPLIQSPGLNGFTTDGNGMSGAFAGEAFTPRWPTAKRFTTIVGIRGTDVATFRTNRNAFAAATANGTVGEYVVHDGSGSTFTYFARVVDRDIPRDSEGEVFRNTEATVTFEVLDGLAYGAATTVTFTGASDSETVTSGGWVGSERWKWTVPGPVTNPQISTSLHGGGVVRYVGSIGADDTLIVELLPKGNAPGYYAKVVPDAQVANYATVGVGTEAYERLDAGASYSGVPPRWFAIEPGAQTIAYAATSGTGGSTFVWRAGYN